MVVQFVMGKIGLFHVFDDLLHHVGGKDGELLWWVMDCVIYK
jgi:hypothetical protein